MENIFIIVVTLSIAILMGIMVSKLSERRLVKYVNVKKKTMKTMKTMNKRRVLFY